MLKGDGNFVLCMEEVEKVKGMSMNYVRRSIVSEMERLALTCYRPA